MAHSRPPALKRGDRIGYFSPSSPATAYAPKRHQRAVHFLRQQGFDVVAGQLTGQQDGYRSGTIEARARELNALLRDPTIRCVMSTIGGSNSNALLPHIDYDAIRRDPKIIVGYSDVTAILQAITQQTGLITFYGPALVASLGELDPLRGQTWEAFWQIVCVDGAQTINLHMPERWTDEYVPWEQQTEPKNTAPNQWRTLRDGQATGRLIGGNLNTMSGLWQTPYLLAPRPGDILLIEDSLKNAAHMERLFSHLHNTGLLNQLGGLIMGKHEGFDDQETNKQPEDIFLEVVGEPPCPMLSQFDCAHTHPMLTMPLGAQIHLNATAQTVRLLERCVS